MIEIRPETDAEEATLKRAAFDGRLSRLLQAEYIVYRVHGSMLVRATKDDVLIVGR